MNGNDVLSFVRNPRFVNASTVHDRLYNDFSKRTYENHFTNTQPSPLRPKLSTQKSSDPKVEDALMQKKIASDTKLKKLKAKYEAEELKELRPAPQINQNSRILATQSSESSSDLKTKYIISIISNSRFSKLNKNSVLRTPKSALIKLQEPDAPLIQSQDLESLKKYKELVNSRSLMLHPADPPNLLEQSLPNNKNWISERIQKLKRLKESEVEQSQRDLEHQRDVDGSQSYRQMSCRKVVRTQSVSLSYSQLYQIKKSFSASKGSSSKALDKSISLNNSYKSLHCKNLSVGRLRNL